MIVMMLIIITQYFIFPLLLTTNIINAQMSIGLFLFHAPSKKRVSQLVPKNFLFEEHDIAYKAISNGYMAYKVTVCHRNVGDIPSRKIINCHRKINNDDVRTT